MSWGWMNLEVAIQEQSCVLRMVKLPASSETTCTLLHQQAFVEHAAGIEVNLDKVEEDCLKELERKAKQHRVKQGKVQRRVAFHLAL
jgi:hypothetical protein